MSVCVSWKRRKFWSDILDKRIKTPWCCIKWINGDSEMLPMEDVRAFMPHFVLFSPMTCSFSKSLKLYKNIREAVFKTKSIFSRLHIYVIPEDSKNELIDYAVLGPVFGKDI